MKPIKVLMVCLGNICRSPTAQGVFADWVAKRGLQPYIMIDSAGIGAWHVGHSPDSRAQQAAQQRGIDLSEQKARQVNSTDSETFDYIIAMDQQNKKDLLQMAGVRYADKVHLLLDFRVGQPKGQEVPDPYYGGDDGFERVLDLIEVASQDLLAHIRQQHC